MKCTVHNSATVLPAGWEIYDIINRLFDIPYQGMLVSHLKCDITCPHILHVLMDGLIISYIAVGYTNTLSFP